VSTHNEECGRETPPSSQHTRSRFTRVPRHLLPRILDVLGTLRKRMEETTVSIISHLCAVVAISLELETSGGEM
jgi:hypothetical protein